MMARIVVPKIVRQLDLREYAEELTGEICVWVNPPRGKIGEVRGYLLAARELAAGGKDVVALGEKLDALAEAEYGWFAEIWSQGAEETRWSVEEVRSLVAGAAETDPGLWNWLMRRTFEMIQAHRDGKKK